MSAIRADADTGMDFDTPPPSPPEGFDAFWHTTLEQLTETPLQPGLRREGPRGEALLLDRIDYVSLGGVRIHGYMLGWDDGVQRPLIVHGHGYNSQYAIMLHWARRGYNVVGFDARGFGRSSAAAPHPAPGGWILTGAESPGTSILRGAVCDYLRALAAAQALLTHRVGRVVFYGQSFAGGLAVIAAALCDRVDLLVAAQPTLGWAAERQRLARAGSAAEVARHLRRHPERVAALMHTLAYFDTMNHAPRVTVPALVGVGRRDPVVPAPTVMATVNNLGGPVELRVLPVSHSSDPREALWDRFEQWWLELAADGPPADFGAPERRVLTLDAD